VTTDGVSVRAATLDDVTGMSRIFVDTYRSAHRGQMPECLLLERTYEATPGTIRMSRTAPPSRAASAAW
jgi:hypothetical protein